MTTEDSVDDEQLVRRAERGDRKAFEQLVARYSSHVFALALSITGNVHDASDVCQEAFLAAYRSLSALRDPSCFAAWLTRITRHRAFRVHAAGGASPLSNLLGIEDLLPADASTPAQTAEERELCRVVRQAVSALPRKLADVVRDHYFNSMSYQDIALRLGVPLSTVKARLHQARQKLRPALDAYGPLDEEEVMTMVAEEKQKFAVPTVDVQPCPGESMEVRLVGPPWHSLPLREGARREWVQFPLVAPEHAKPRHYFERGFRVIGRAIVDGEECWQIQSRLTRTPPRAGFVPSSSTRFIAERPDGFYGLLWWSTELRRDGSSMLKVGCASSLEITLEPDPKVIRPGMKWTRVGGRQKCRCEGVVQVSINQHQERCLEVIQPKSHKPTGHMHWRHYINGDGLAILRLDYEPEWPEDGPELWKSPPVTPREASFEQYHAYVGGVTVPTDLLKAS